MNVLNQLQIQDKQEGGVDQAELNQWAEKVEKAISGNKCIICLQEFKVDTKDQVKVILCPFCNYAGHPNHFITWLDERNACPMCRSALSKNNLLRGVLEIKDEQLVFTQT